jgi:hypothetical protein
LLWVAASQVAAAQIPGLGRYQDFAYSAEAVQAQASIAYDQLLADLRRKGQLDDEPEFDERVHRIAAALIEKAIEQKPSAGTWAWKVHTTSAPNEVAHAFAELQREELSQVFYLDAGSIPISVTRALARIDSNLSLQIEMSTLLKIQASEADELGMILAHNAGWPATSMVSFYTKLAVADTPTLLSWAYPSAASRLNMAQILRITFSRQR